MDENKLQDPIDIPSDNEEEDTEFNQQNDEDNEDEQSIQDMDESLEDEDDEDNQSEFNEDDDNEENIAPTDLEKTDDTGSNPVSNFISQGISALGLDGLLGNNETKENEPSSDMDETMSQATSGTMDYSDDDYDSDIDEEVFKKIDNHEIKDDLGIIHPESNVVNYDEIYTLSQVVRKDNMIVDVHHQTLGKLTRFEKARILGQRVKQLDQGSIPYVSGYENCLDNYLIAEKELTEKVLPFIIRRPLPDGTSEYWKLGDLEIL